jgi:uncharacterized membrane protein
MAAVEKSASEAPSETKHAEVLEIAPENFADTQEFRDRERICVRKLDFVIAPLMGAFNFIVSLIASFILWGCTTC